MANLPAEDVVTKLLNRADSWQVWINDDLEATFAYMPLTMIWHQRLDRDAAAEIGKLRKDMDAERLKRQQVEHERDVLVEDLAGQQREIERLLALATQFQRDNSALISRLARYESAADVPALRSTPVESCTHEFRPIDSRGQVACIYCNARATPSLHVTRG